MWATPPAAPGGRKFSEQAPPASFVCALQLLGSRLIGGLALLLERLRSGLDGWALLQEVREHKREENRSCAPTEVTSNSA